jgi:hypothetical protein
MKYKFYFTIIFIFAICSLFKDEVLSRNYGSHSFLVDAKVKKLLMGDSHAQYGFSDNIISDSLNVSYRSEKFIWTYLKMKNLLKNNLHLDSVILSVSKHSFQKCNEREILGSERSFFYARYGALFEAESYTDLFQENLPNTDLLLTFLKYQLGAPIEGFRDLRLRFKSSQVLKSDLPYWGYFQKEKGHNLSKRILEDTLDRHYSCAGVSRLQEKYFQKIIKLTTKYDVRLHLVTLPTHKSYREGIPLELKKHFKSQLKQAQIQGSHLLDLSEVRLPDSYFKDFDHLNTKGANYIGTTYLEEIL